MAALLTLVGLPFAIAANTDAACEANLFPLYAGGSQQEYTNCFAFDEKRGFLILGGNTTSGDFGPYEYWTTGFLYATDLNGNWQWGRQIYNKDYTVQTSVSGCQMSSDGQSLTLLVHEGSSQMELEFPTIMHIDTQDGDIKSSYSLEWNK